MNIKKQNKAEMERLMNIGEKNSRIFKSVASEMYQFAPQKLNESQKAKVKSIAEKSAELIVKGIPESKKAIKRFYTEDEWKRDCKIVEDVMVIGTGRLTGHAQAILNIVNGEFGQCLEASLDTTVVPTLKMCCAMIRNACDMINYCGECLEEAFHDEWDLIVEIDDIKSSKAWERYETALKMLDADMRKKYENKKKQLEKQYGDAIHRSKAPEDVYYYEDENGNR